MSQELLIHHPLKFEGQVDAVFLVGVTHAETYTYIVDDFSIQDLDVVEEQEEELSLWLPVGMSVLGIGWKGVPQTVTTKLPLEIRSNSEGQALSAVWKGKSMKDIKVGVENVPCIVLKIGIPLRVSSLDEMKDSLFKFTVAPSGAYCVGCCEPVALPLAPGILSMSLYAAGCSDSIVEVPIVIVQSGHQTAKELSEKVVAFCQSRKLAGNKYVSTVMTSGRFPLVHNHSTPVSSAEIRMLTQEIAGCEPIFPDNRPDVTEVVKGPTKQREQAVVAKKLGSESRKMYIYFGIAIVLLLIAVLIR